jgi:hypothetical protein
VGHPRGKEGVDNYRVPVRHKEGKQGGKENVLTRVLYPKQLTLITNDYQGVMTITLTRISPARQVGTVVHPIATDVIPSDGSDLVIHPR